MAREKALYLWATARHPQGFIGAFLPSQASRFQEIGEVGTFQVEISGCGAYGDLTWRRRVRTPGRNLPSMVQHLKIRAG